MAHAGSHPFGQVTVGQCWLFGLDHPSVEVLRLYCPSLVQLVLGRGKLSDLMQQVSALPARCDARVPVRDQVTSSNTRATASHADIMQTRVAFTR